MTQKIKFNPIVSQKVVEYNIKNLRHLIFEVTDACNLNCKYCGFSEFYNGYDERSGTYQSFEKVKSFIDYLASIWKNCKYENIQQPLTVGFYGGEPLLNMKFIKQVIDHFDNLTDIGKRVKYNMTTNAMLLDRYMDFLVEKEFHLLISLDGDKDGQSYRVDHRGKNSFNVVMRNVRQLQSNYPDYFVKYVAFNSVLHNRNSVKSAIEFVKNEFGHIPQISELNGSGVKPEKREEFYRTYKNAWQSFNDAPNCKQMIDEIFIGMPQVVGLSRYISNDSGNSFESYYEFRKDKSVLGFAQTGTCTPFMLKLFITVNGKILPCEKINHEFALGQIYDDHFDFDFDKVVHKQNGYLKKIEKQCTKCSKATNCGYCIYQTDNLNTDTNVCCPQFTTSNINNLEIESINFLRENPHLYERIINEVTIK